MNDVINQAQEAIDEIVPRARCVLQAAIEQRPVRFGECHVQVPDPVPTDIFPDAFYPTRQAGGSFPALN
jgi:hypothetical protein